MAASSARGNEPPSTGDDGPESANDDPRWIKPKRMPDLRALQVESLKIKYFLGEDNRVYVELSGSLPFVSHERVVHRRMTLSDFRRFMGYSDQQYDAATAAVQSTLRANPSHDPGQYAYIDDPRAQLESRMTPSKPKCFRMVPHLLSPEIVLQCKDEDSIEKTFDLDHRGGFTVYKVSSTGGWSLLDALVAALTFQHPSYQFSVLGLFYYYKKAVEDEPVNRVSAAGFLAPANPAGDRCMFDWDITAQAMDSYMEYLGFGSHTFILVQPPSNKTTPPSRVFTVPCALTDRAVTQMQRVWIVYTANKDQVRPQFNVVIKHDIKLSPHLVNSVNELNSQQAWEYSNKIRMLEADLMDRNVSMTSLPLQEIQELFHETKAARHEHMSRPEFGSKAIKPSRLSQRPNHRKRELTLSTPSPHSLFDPETRRSRRKCRSLSPMSDVSVQFPYEMMVTGPKFAKGDSDSDESNGSLIIQSPELGEASQSVLKRAGPEDIPPPDAKKTKFYYDDEQDVAPPRSALLESVNADRQRREAITRRRNKLLGLGGKKWPLRGGNKK